MIVKYSLVQDVKGVSLEPFQDQARQVTTSIGVVTKVRQATISIDVIAKSETTMWLSQLNQWDNDVVVTNKSSNHISDVIVKSETTMWLSQINQSISTDVIAKIETTMWLSQINQATTSDDVITKGETSNHID